LEILRKIVENWGNLWKIEEVGEIWILDVSFQDVRRFLNIKNKISALKC
jgi:hypothetical protein